MRAVRVGPPGRVVLADVPEPAPAPGEVIVRVAAASVCATDRKLAARGADPPRVPGHEVAGWLPDGTPVGVQPDIGCGRCAVCADGFENRCPRRQSVGLARDGGLAEAVAVPAAHAVPVGDVDLLLAPLLEPLACCVHAVRRAGAVAGDRAVVVGAGPMGLLAMWALQAVGARVAICQRSRSRQDEARRLGADAVLGPDDDAVREFVRTLGGPPRIAMVTPPGAPALGWALEHVEAGGTVHAFAGTPGGAGVDANLVHYRHLSLVGSTGSTLDDYRAAVDLAAGAVDLARLPHRDVGLEEIPGTLVDGAASKVVAVPGRNRHVAAQPHQTPGRT